MAMVVDMLAQLAAQKRVTGQDVLAARAVLYADMSVSPTEAEALFKINDAVLDDCREWRELFVEAMTDYLVRQQSPAGYVDEAKAAWLEDWILADGNVRGETELELLIYILEQADKAPANLYRLALDCLRGQALAAPAITAGVVERLRRVLYAFAGSEGGSTITRAEAEVLFELNEKTRGRANDPSWKDLFVRAIGASIMAAGAYVAPEAEEAARREAWLASPGEGTGSFYARMLRSLASPERFGLREGADDAVFWARNAEREVEALAAARVDAGEAEWLAERIGRDGVLDENEIALLEFVAREAGSLHPAIAPLIERARNVGADVSGRPAALRG